MGLMMNKRMDTALRLRVPVGPVTRVRMLRVSIAWPGSPCRLLRALGDGRALVLYLQVEGGWEEAPLELSRVPAGGRRSWNAEGDDRAAQ